MQVDKNNIAVVKRLMKSVIVLLGAAMLTLTGCSKYKEIRPTSFKLESVSIHGLRSVDLEVSVGVNNPAGQLTISDFSGEVEHSGKVLGKLSLAPLVLMPRKDTVYRVSGRIDLSNELSIVQALSYVRKPQQLQEATVDINAKAKLKSGLSKNLKYEDIPVEKLLKLLQQ